MPSNFPEGVRRVGGDVLAFPLKMLEPGFNGRAEPYDEQKMLELAESIASNPRGQVEPGYVQRRDDGKFVVRVGSGRRAAIEHINRNLAAYRGRFPHLDGPLPFAAFAPKMSEEEWVAVTLAENHYLPYTDVDRAYQAQHLTSPVAEGGLGWTLKKAAEAMGCSESMVSVHLQTLDAPPEALELVKERKMPATLARELRKAKPEVVREAVKAVKRGEKPSHVQRKVKEASRVEGKQAGLTMAEFRAQLVDVGTQRGDALAKYLGGSQTIKALAKILTDEAWKAS